MFRLIINILNDMPMNIPKSFTHSTTSCAIQKLYKNVKNGKKREFTRSFFKIKISFRRTPAALQQILQHKTPAVPQQSSSSPSAAEIAGLQQYSGQMPPAQTPEDLNLQGLSMTCCVSFSSVSTNLILRIKP